jgi:hypothetical protein
MEPWDGPASIAFTDGTVVGAVLDRNGLRPSRYYVTKDDIVVMASEVGVLGDEIAPENVAHKSRLQPGRMFLVDTAQGRIIADEEIKQTMAALIPTRNGWTRTWWNWTPAHAARPLSGRPDHGSVLHRQHVFGYTFETLRTLLAPMAKNGVEALGSMGDDTPIARSPTARNCSTPTSASLFAQVTNPPLDAIREELVTATDVMLGTEGNVLETAPENCHQIRLKNPILTNEQLPSWRASRSRLQGAEAADALSGAIKGLAGAGEGARLSLHAGRRGHRAGRQHLHSLRPGREPGDGADPCAAGHCRSAPSPDPPRDAHPVRAGRRIGRAARGASLLLLIGYGATAVNPYMAYETIYDLIDQGLVTDIVMTKAKANYIKASIEGRDQGLLKDGHQHTAELLRRANLRGAGAEQGAGGQVLHLDADAHRGHRAARDLPRSASAAICAPTQIAKTRPACW